MMTKKKIRLVLSTATLTLLGSAAHASERWATLQAINWVENPTNQTRVGPRGELGPYQFRPSTWRMHSTQPFSFAVQRRLADEVAVKHYEWIKAGLERAGIQPVPFNIALAWNSGLEAVVSGRAPSVSFRYAEQVQNLVETLQERVGRPTGDRTAASTPPVPRFDVADNSSRFSVPIRGPRFVLGSN